MSHSHFFLATEEDYSLIAQWIAGTGAISLNGDYQIIDPHSPKQFLLHYPMLGPVVYWPSKIPIAEYPGNAPRDKRAILASIRQRESPDVRQIDADNCPVAGLTTPYLRDGLFWTSGTFWFPTAKLKDRFPALEKMNTRFQRWLRRFTLVYDGMARPPYTEYEYYIGGVSGFGLKLYALPQAYDQLRKGRYFLCNYISDKIYQEFLQSLRLRGVQC